MQVRDIMTEDPACCGPGDTVKDAARLMVENDCGEIPVVDENGAPIGVVTDRDIACRGVAEGKSLETRVGDVMSAPAVTVTPETSVDDCCATMEENQIRRVPVVDDDGKCCGMASQADIARIAEKEETSELVRRVSEPTREPSQAGCC